MNFSYKLIIIYALFLNDNIFLHGSMKKYIRLYVTYLIYRLKNIIIDRNKKYRIIISDIFIIIYCLIKNNNRY